MIVQLKPAFDDYPGIPGYAIYDSSNNMLLDFTGNILLITE